MTTVAPTVAMTAPATGTDTNNNKPTLSATATDNSGSGLANVLFEYSSNGGSTWKNAGSALTAAPYSYTFTTALPDGIYEAQAIATDNDGDIGTSLPVTFTIDTVAPTVMITAPANGTTTSNNEPTLSATASDNVGLAHCQFEYSSNGGTTWNDAGSPLTAAPFNFTFTTALANGAYEARAIATDLAGNSATSATVSFTIGASTVLFSDSFDRPSATEDNLGQADNSLGGTGTYYYVPIFNGAVIESNTLESNSTGTGGVEFTTSSDTSATRGTSVGQDLDITVSLLVPAGSGGSSSYAGIFFRSRAAFTNDGIVGGEPFDPSGGYWVRLASTGVIQVVDLRNNMVTAYTARPASFNATGFHTLEVAFQGNGLQVALDGVLQNFNEGGNTVAIPSTGLPGDTTLTGDVSAGNDGTAGIAFGDPPEGGGASGGEVKDLIVTSYSSIASLPVSETRPSSMVNPLPATTTTTSFPVSWVGWPGPGASSISSYTIYVSQDGGPFKAILVGTTASSGTFTGEAGQTYALYSVATDNLGNVQPTPTAAQATTFVAGPPSSAVGALPATTTSTTFTVSWSGSAGAGATSITSYEIFVSDNGGAFTPFLTKTTATSATFTGQFGHTYGFYSVATNNLGIAQPTPTAAQATTMVQSPPAPPMIIGENSMFHRKTNRKGKPVGSPVLTGFSLTFNARLDSATADNAGNFQLDSVTTKKVRKKTTTSLHPITAFTVSYDDATDTVDLTLIGKQAFPTGGQLTVVGIPPNGISGASGAPLGGNIVFTISKKGSTITPAT